MHWIKKVSELKDVFHSGFIECPLGFNNVDWFVDEFIKTEKKTIFFKSSTSNIIMTEEDGKHFTNNKKCQFCEKETLIEKVWINCHLSGKYRGPAHRKCSFNFTQN